LFITFKTIKNGTYANIKKDERFITHTDNI